jgi:hypothetical protein
MASQLFTSLFRRSPSVSGPAIHFPYNLHTNPYRCKRIWPPDFAKLSPKHQFRLERRYRRRTQLKWARPTWTKAVKLTQWGAIMFVLVYGVLFLDMGDMRVGPPTGEKMGTPFEAVRKWYWEQVGGLRGVREGARKEEGKEEGRTG